MQIVSLVNNKGSVAKTTTALALASGLSKRNFHALAIDCDAQANFSKASGGKDNVVGTFDILTGKENINEVIQELPLYHLIGADKSLSSIDVALNKPGREFQLKKALSQLSSAYDSCIIDNPPALNVAVTNYLVASHKIVICSSAEASALDGLMELSANLDNVHQFMNPALIVDGILITIFNPRTIIGQYMKEQLSRIAQVMNTKVYNTVIRRCNTISVSQSDRKCIFYYSTTNAAMTMAIFLMNF